MSISSRVVFGKDACLELKKNGVGELMGPIVIPLEELASIFDGGHGRWRQGARGSTFLSAAASLAADGTEGEGTDGAPVEGNGTVPGPLPSDDAKGIRFLSSRRHA